MGDLTNSQDRTVTFRTGMDGAIPLPGWVIPVADALLAGREIGGGFLRLLAE